MKKRISIHLGKYLGVALLDYLVSVCVYLTLQEIANLFFLK